MSTFPEIVAAAEPISLAELNSTAALMSRSEQKYFVPPDLLAQILTDLGGVKVLQIDGVRHHEYSSVYFDTGNLLFFRQHVQGRRIRHKVRIRSYSSGESFLEVKAKGGRGQTVKERIRLPHGPHLGAEAREFIDRHLGHPGASHALSKVLTTIYTRVTFAVGPDRVTCDFNLRFQPFRAGRPYGAGHEGPTQILVETKTATGRSRVDSELTSAGIRPTSVSKYGVGIALGFPDVPTNRWNRVLRHQFDHTPEETPLNVHSLLRMKEAGVTTAMVSS